MSENRRSITIEAVLPPRNRKTSMRTSEESKPAKKQRLDIEIDASTGAIKKTTTVWKPPKVSHTGVPNVARRTATLPVSPFVRGKKHSSSSSTVTKVSSSKSHSKVVAATITREGQLTPQLPIKLSTQHKRNQNFDTINNLEHPVPKPRAKVAQSPKKQKHNPATNNLTGLPEIPSRNLKYKYLLEGSHGSKKEQKYLSNSPMAMLEKIARKNLMELARTSPKKAQKDYPDFNYLLDTSSEDLAIQNYTESPLAHHFTASTPKAVQKLVANSKGNVLDLIQGTTDYNNAAVPFRSVPLQASLATASNHNNANVYTTPTATRKTEGSLPKQDEENNQHEFTPVAAQRLIKCECAPDQLFHENLETIMDANTTPENVLHRLRRLSLGSLGQLLRELQSYGFECLIMENECPVIALALMRTLLEEEELAFQGLVQASAINLPKTPLHLLKTVVDQDDDEAIELEGAVALPPKGVSPGPQPFGYCLICWEKAREVAFVPCGHVACCDECSQSELLRFCPTCRGEILDIVRVFLP